MALIKQQILPTHLDRIQMINGQCLFAMKQAAKNTFDLMWKVKDKTPQEVCDLLGTDAGKAFELHSALQMLIYGMDDTWVPLTPPNAYTVSESGNVTIGEPV